MFVQNERRKSRRSDPSGRDGISGWWKIRRSTERSKCVAREMRGGNGDGARYPEAGARARTDKTRREHG